MKKGYLILQDGQVFEGVRFGAETDTVGELVFTTGMCGYVETLTDPSYAGQIVMQTYPLIGNYGIIREDFEGACCVKGYVVREYCDTPSNFRTDCDLDTYLKEQGVPGLCGVDTRELTRIIREHGVMNAAICDAVPEDLAPLRAYRITDPVPQVTTPEPYALRPEGDVRFRVSLLDYGAKRNIVRELQKRGCTVTVLPATTSAEEILAANPDGIMLSNGPGDPKECKEIIAEIRKLYESDTPIFAICLGHQLMALATGADTHKMKYGHRGGNHPVKDLATGRVYISSQNHGYVVDTDKLDPNVAEPAFINVNDGTNEGLKYVNNDMCYPIVLNAGQMIDALQSGKYDINRTRLLMPTAGDACRGANYLHVLKESVRKAGFDRVKILSLNVKGLEKECQMRVHPFMVWRALFGLFYGDILMLLLNQTRPNEVKKGQSQRMWQKWIDILSRDLKEGKNLTLGRMKRNFVRIARDFSRIKLHDKRKQRVGIVGELYIKYCHLGNWDMIKFLESNGCESHTNGLSWYAMYYMDSHLTDNMTFESLLYKAGLMGM